MFVGHLGVALLGKRVAPRTSLGYLVAATYGLDLLWPVFLLTGIERVHIDPGNTAFTPLDFEWYPWSHSMVAALVWAGLGALTFFAAYRRRSDASIIGCIVFSHWLLDLITHRPDLPVLMSGPMVGFGLWRSIPATIAVEGSILVAGVIAYLSLTRARDAVGRWALWALIALVSAIWLAGPWSSPPPSSRAIAYVGLAMLIFPFWAHWIDAHREIGRA